MKTYLYGFFFVIGLGIVFNYCGLDDMRNAVSPLRQVNNVGGFVFASWMLMTMYLSLKLIFSGSFRDAVLSRITFLKERDEREKLFSGQAAKTTFMLTLAVLFFLLSLSCFEVSVYRVPPEKAINGKTGVLTLGVRLELLKDRSAPAPETFRRDIFSHTDLPISSTALILLLIGWQIASYNLCMRRFGIRS
ncbi:MAG TPA: hypothetical protein P5079_10560 [Elusimicrobiota bacterium]|nr:hypothetical protein [Elusimicrobiota bacterium]